MPAHPFPFLRNLLATKDRLPQSRRSLAATSLAGLLLLTGGWCVTTAIAPPAVQAYTSKVDITLDVLGGETFKTLLSRAESAARAASQRSFDRDILISDVNVVVVAQKDNVIAPILSLQVNRAGWKSRPDPRYWSTYYRDAQRLLNME